MLTYLVGGVEKRADLLRRVSVGNVGFATGLNPTCKLQGTSWLRRPMIAVPWRPGKRAAK
jgi:hypothetical protein